MISDCVSEGRLLLRSSTAWTVGAILAILASVSVVIGLREVVEQEAAILRLVDRQTEDARAIAQHVQKDAGAAAYYRFHATWDTPAPLAFAAVGQRDVSPNLLRVRALALEGQIYESESGNPELAVMGRFDFAFVLVFLVPLFLIALLHDLWSSEREAGRLASLQAMPRAAWRVWGARTLVRSVLVLATVLIPFLVGAGVRGASLGETAAALGLILALIAFWTLLCVLIAARGRRSATTAATLAACWFALTLIVPTAANLGINALTPIPSGAQLVRENREAVHDAWDTDRNRTMTLFYQSHPEWAHSAPMTMAFDWKWYYAFQQLGDEQVADLSREYRAGIALREQRAGLVSWCFPPIAMQRGLHRLARTDVHAQLAYQDRIRAFHERLRRFYYPFLFDKVPFTAADFARTPEFDDRAQGASFELRASSFELAF